MIKAVFNNKAYDIVDSLKITSDNKEVAFDNIKIIFSNYSIADLPYKYQEIKIKQADTEEGILTGTTIYTGFIDNTNFDKMHYINEIRKLNLTLLSPLKMATIRTVSIKGTFTASDLISRILQPLIDDGFTIQAMHIPDTQITVDYLMQTIEFCMNDLGYKKSISWFIDADKKIYINSIDYLFGQNYKIKLDETEPRTDGLEDINPTIENIDYANVLNFKNIRLVTFSNEGHNGFTDGTATGYTPCQLGKTIKKGDTINFDNPVVWDLDYLKTYAKEQGKELSQFFNIYTLDMMLTNSNNYGYSFYIGLNTNTGALWTQGALTITFSDDTGDEGNIVFQRDSFFKNVITGFKWNKDENVTITRAISDCMLRYTTMRFQYSTEIEKQKGIISDSGIVEKSIDLNNKWITIKQLTDYARSLIVQNTNTISSVVLNYTKNPNVQIGDLININMPDFYVVGNFAVTKIEHTYINEDLENWKITVKNSNLIASYIDIFRPSQSENGTDTVDTIILSEFSEEQIKETHKILLIPG